MNWKTLFTQLSALGAFSADRLARFGQLTSARIPDTAALGDEIVALFEELQGGVDRDSAITASMSLLAGAAETVTRARPRRPSPGAANAHRPVRSAARPTTRQSFGGGALTASGEALEDAETLGKAFSRAVHASANGPALLFRSSWEYPEERQLGADAYANANKIDAVCGPQALVASGGTCNPVNVDYSVPVFATAERPLRDALPGFQATRGGVRFATTPTLRSVPSTGTVVWTEANDVALNAPATKPFYTILCGTEVEVFVDAIPTRVQMGNMQARFSPEYVEAIMANVLVAAARVSELNLLSKISAASTAVSTGQLLGASRDLLATVDQVAAAYRDRNRLSDNTILDVLLPRWIRDMIRADLARELAHGDDVAQSFALSNADVNELLSKRGLSATWLLDGLPANAPQGYGYQGFGNQVAGALNDWPRQVVWQIYAEGSFQFLDGGELTVSVVQDSTLNNTNQREFFTETFEAVANRGVESLQVVSTVRPNGLSAGSISTVAY